MTKGKSGAAGRRRTWAMTAAGLMLLGSAAVNLAGAQDAPPETAPEAAPETAEDPAAAAPAETPAPAAAEETASDGGAPAQPPAETAAETASETPASETPAALATSFSVALLRVKSHSPAPLPALLSEGPPIIQQPTESFQP